MLVLPLLLQVLAAPMPYCNRLADGPGEGLCLGPVVSVDGAWETRALVMPPIVNDALSREAAQTVAALLESYDEGRDFASGLIGAQATDTFCTEDDKNNGCLQPRALKGWSLGRGYHHEPPYLMRDGTVRIAWMKNGRLVYLSMISLSGARVSAIRTMPALVVFKK